MSFWKWSRTASSNATADGSVNWAEGQAPSSVNDSARAMMAAAAKFRDDISGAIATSGSSTAYTLSSFQGFDTLPHMDGAMIAFTPHTTSGATVTLSVDGLGAKPLRQSPGGLELPAGTLVQGTPYVATYYNATAEWILRGFAGNPYNIPLGGMLAFTGTTAPNSSFVLPSGQPLSRSIYAAYFAMVGTTYGAGDGSTTFNVIDMRGRVLAGKDDMGGGAAGRVTTAGSAVDGVTLGASGGAENITLAQANLPNVTLTTTIAAGQGSHNHTVTNGSSGVAFTAVSSSGSGVPNATVITTSSTTLPAMSGTTPLGGSGTAFKIMQPSIIGNYILRVL
jgi:microcystin-dependent protein